MQTRGCAVLALAVLAAVPNVLAQGRAQGPAPAAQAGQPASRPPTTGTGVILGQVVDARENRPIGGAVVSISGVPLVSPGGRGAAPIQPTTAGPTGPRRVLSDAQGRFMFFGLPPGQYTVSASAPGYLNGLAGQTRPNGTNRMIVLRDDQKSGNVTVPLWRYAVLSGTVLDEAGEPAVNIPVRVLRRVTTGLKTRFAQASTVRTDDRGQYRAAMLTVGDYLVAVPSSTTTVPTSAIDALRMAQSARDNGASARAIENQLSSSSAPMPNAGGTRVGSAYVQNRDLQALGPVSTQGDKVWMYQTSFFAGTTTSTQATLITLSAGEERPNVDFQLRPVPAFKVSGVVSSPEGPASNLGVRLLPANLDDFTSDNGLEVATTVTEADGTFQFLGVPPGAYVAKVLRVPRPTMTNVMQGPNGPTTFSVRMAGAVVSEPTLWADANLAVGDADVSGIPLVLRIGPRISGRIEFDGATPRPPMDRTPAAISVNLSPVDTRNPGVSMPGAIVVNANGQFSGPSMPPGRYTLSAGAPGWTLRSAMVGGIDISDVPIDIESTDLGGVVVTFFDRPAQMSGVVRNARGEAEDGAMVYVIPANYSEHLGRGVTPRHLRTTRSTADGRYTLSGLLPGDYIVAAVSDGAGEGDPIRFLDAAARVGTRITISDSEKKGQDLSLTQVQIR